MNRIKIFFIGFSLSVSVLWGQKFSKEVQNFISVDTTLVAITHVKLIDGTGSAVKNNQTIIIKNNKIESIGASNTVKIPEDAYVIKGSGKTVIPGLVMLHEHLFYPKFFENWYSVNQLTFSFPRLYLAGGVTTMRTAGSIQPQTDLNIKKWILEGKMTGPKMDVTSPFIDREGVPIASIGFIKNSKEVKEIVNFWANRGVTSFKLYNNVTKEDLKTCINEAHKRGLKVTGHLCSVTYEEASNLGIDNLEHGFRVSSDFVKNKDSDICDPFEVRNAYNNEPVNSTRINTLIATLIKNGTTLTTTPNVFEPYTGRELIPGGGEKAVTPELLNDVTQIYNQYVNKDSIRVAGYKKNMIWIKRFYDQGGKLVAGTDPTGAGRTVAGYANQHTLELLHEAGFPLVDVVKICTFNGAKYLNQDQTIGTIETGKTADLILINGDLESNINNIRNMEIVFKDGIGYDSKKLFDSVNGLVGLK
ncbi:amidohydrolase family protein [Aestuariibaculum sediminum]|uniref:Amidohydrolase family protein n=1 Tax=Aestuariibaculum sediminum TaxID=2770637 RepID=A0A8J6Q030_9FLAO|nr:amidohydrolase family protein [Aestuariibaculum sediminum]MBD0832072.1 amidohydrolase family protein [Aestuariibaculum sediminum]